MHIKSKIKIKKRTLKGESKIFDEEVVVVVFDVVVVVVVDVVAVVVVDVVIVVVVVVVVVVVIIVVVVVQRIRHSKVPSIGALGNLSFIDFTSAAVKLYVLCNAISGSSNPRVLIVINPKK